MSQEPQPQLAAHARIKRWSRVWK